MHNPLVSQVLKQRHFVVGTLHWGTANADIKDPSLENPELKDSLLKHGLGQNITINASPNARDFFLELFSTRPVHSSAFFPKTSPEFFLCKYWFLRWPAD